MDKPIYKAVLDLLAARKGQWRQISAEAGVPYSTLCKVAQGHIGSPSVHLVQKLYDHLAMAPEDGYRESGVLDGPPPCDEAAREGVS